MVLTPSDDFTYTQTNTNNTATFSCFGFGGFSKFWLYVSVGTLLLVMMLVLATAAGVRTSIVLLIYSIIISDTLQEKEMPIQTYPYSTI